MLSFSYGTTSCLELRGWLLNINGDDLYAMRKSKGKTTKQMAQHLGVTRNTYENWEHGVGEPKMSQFIKLCVFCAVDVSPLLNQFSSLKKLSSGNSVKAKKVSNANK